MLPYIHIPPLDIGGWLVIQPFGVLVVIGCALGWQIAVREARLRSLDPKVVESAGMWGLLIGFPMASFVAVAFYFPEQAWANPLLLLQFWKNMSSFGGFLGGAIGVLGYLWLKKKPILAYLDCFIVGLLVGWFFGRMGCSIVHDHPGLPTQFPLGVRFPDGPRHDLGLYEWFYTIFMLAVVFSLPRAKMPAGMVLGIVCVLYAPVRFGLDFLRVADRLYLGFTPGQYMAVALLLVGLGVVWKSMRDTPQPSRA